MIIGALLFNYRNWANLEFYYLIDILSLYKETGVWMNFGKDFCTFTHPNNISSLLLGVHIQDEGLCI